MLKLFAKFMAREEGATAIEYGLIAAGIAVAISIIVFTLGDEVAETFGEVNTAVSGRGAAE